MRSDYLHSGSECCHMEHVDMKYYKYTSTDKKVLAATVVLFLWCWAMYYENPDDSFDNLYHRTKNDSAINKDPTIPR